ncbi:hypothetical protein VZT92_014098 [Zoarces viviparus]|uniref:Uncharacterized protein n=1 Tax=Zoarces viviparus TaxID=48416 RepID=A0AAW1EYG2_ZOAVI
MRKKEAEERREAFPEQVAEASRCCREAAKQIMSCLDYLRGLITVERLIWVSSKLVLQGSAVPTVPPGGLRSHLS